VLERAFVSIFLAAFFVAGYFLPGLYRNPAAVYELRMPLDQRIPFTAGWVWVYLWVFPFSLSPLFVVRSIALLRKVATAYFVVLAVSFICFALFPVSSTRLRAPEACLDLSQPSQLLVSTLYRLDPALNLFPSLHVAITTLAALSIFRISRLYGWLGFATAGLVGVAVCMIRQHFLLDVLGGVILSCVVGVPILWGYRRREDISLSYSWRGAVTYLMFVAVFYSSSYFGLLWYCRIASQSAQRLADLVINPCLRR